MPGSLIERAILLAVGLMALGYAFLLPSFEGPDEPEHASYVRAWSEWGVIERPRAGEPFAWGYEVYQPPLYYALAGSYAKLGGLGFADAIMLNPAQNPRFPYIRHDLPAERFPWRDEHLGVRLLRLPSVALGLATCLVLLWLGRMLFPGDSFAAALWVALALLAPRSLQAFATVGNDASVMLFGSLAVALAVAIVKRRWDSSFSWAACGLALALAVLAKYTGALVGVCVAAVLAIDLRGRPARTALVRGLALGAPLLLVLGGHLLFNLVRYGDPTWASIVREMFPAFMRPAPAPLGELLPALAGQLPSRFAADLCWQTCQSETLGHVLFWPWLLASGVFAWRVCANRLPAQSRTPELWLPVLALVASAASLVLLSRVQTNFQLRHVLAVWPLLMLPPVYLARSSPSLWTAVRKLVVPAVACGLVAANVSLWIDFREFRRPLGSTALDRDYHTAIYALVQNPERASVYIQQGTFLNYDVNAAYRTRNWNEVIRLIEAEAGAPNAPLDFMYSVALYQVGRRGEALRRVERLSAVYPPARPFHVKIAESIQGPEAARRLQQRYEREKLER